MSEFAAEIERRLQIASELVSEKSLLDLVELIWRNDRFFTFPAYNTTAQLTAARFREWKIDSETCNLPADGKTIFGDWKMPLAWECKGATLEVVEPVENHGKVLADWKHKPTHVVMWSGPTPPDGITAEVIKISKHSDLSTNLDKVRGKIVYTPLAPREFKKLLADNGALGVITSFCRNRELIPDDCFWINGWSDNPGGWAFQAGDTPLPGMLITLRTAEELDAMLSRGPVKLKMKVDSRYFEGTVPVVAGLVPGQSQTEILAIGHAMEQGANDNASGCALIMESLRVIEEAVRNGKLSPLKRGVRGILTNECYGTIGYAVKNPETIRRTIMGINWDSLGRCNKEAQGNFKHHRCPDAVASVADTLMSMLLRAWLPGKLPAINFQHELPYSLTDNAYCDPLLGVHCVYVDSQDAFWHTSADVPQTIEARTLHTFATINVAYLHYLATATAKEALALAEETVHIYESQFKQLSAEYSGLLAVIAADKPAVLANAFDHLDYTAEICNAAVKSAQRLMTAEEIKRDAEKLAAIQAGAVNLAEAEKQKLRAQAGCEPSTMDKIQGFDDIAQRRPLKKFVGTPAYDGVPLEKQDGISSPVWDVALHAALFWADGKHTISDIVRRIQYEYGGMRGPRLATHFKFMAEHGLIEWK
jgi:hypothetical protein